MEKMLTTEEAADTLRISTRTLYTWIGEGKLSGVKVGRKWLFKEGDVRALLSPVASSAAKPQAAE